MANIQLLHGPAADEALAEEPHEAFSYQMNKAGIGFVVGGGALFLVSALVTWLFTRLGGALSTSLFVLFMVLGLTLFSLATHWMNFVRDSFVATSPSYLFVGHKGRVWRISWALLDARTMGFHDMELKTLKGFLDLRVAGQQVKIHLFNAFALLEDIQGLMLQILEHLQPGKEDESSSH